MPICQRSGDILSRDSSENTSQSVAAELDLSLPEMDEELTAASALPGIYPAAAHQLAHNYCINGPTTVIAQAHIYPSRAMWTGSEIHIEPCED